MKNNYFLYWFIINGSKKITKTKNTIYRLKDDIIKDQRIVILPRYPGGYPNSLILLSHGGGSSSCITTDRTFIKTKFSDISLHSIYSIVIVHHKS